MISEPARTNIKEVIVLSKFEGDPVPENEFERIHIVDGQIIRKEQVENGEVVSSENVKEVE